MDRPLDCPAESKVLIYKREGETWLLQAEIEFPNALELVVALWEDYLLAGDRYDSENGYDAGAVYVYKRESENWVMQAKLLASDGSEEDLFGEALSIFEEYAIIGAPTNGSEGSAYIFKREGESWSQKTKLTGRAGAHRNSFGESVAIEGDYAVVGANGDDENGEFSGATYVFKRERENWVQIARLTEKDGAPFNNYGFAVAISDESFVVGSPGEPGASYVYYLTGSVAVEPNDASFPERITLGQNYPNPWVCQVFCVNDLFHFLVLLPCEYVGSVLFIDFFTSAPDLETES